MEHLPYTLDLAAMLQVVLLGFIGGTLSGFIGSGGAFFLTPGMMNLGVPGVIAVGSNITHKFGKALVGSRKHGEMGNVDKKVGLFMLLTAAAGIRIAVWINTMLFKAGKSVPGSEGAAANLYISVVFAGILSLVSLAILLWPLIQTPRFWLTLGVVTGIIGSLVFTLAIQQEKTP